MKPTNKEQTNRSIEINFISSFLDVVGDYDEAGKKTGQRHLSVNIASFIQSNFLFAFSITISSSLIKNRSPKE